MTSDERCPISSVQYTIRDAPASVLLDLAHFPAFLPEFLSRAYKLGSTDTWYFKVGYGAEISLTFRKTLDKIECGTAQVFFFFSPVGGFAAYSGLLAVNRLRPRVDRVKGAMFSCIKGLKIAEPNHHIVSP